MLKSVLFKLYSKDILKNYSNMLWIMQDPSSGSDQLYWTEITYNGSVVHDAVCIVGVWRHILNCNGEGNY
jgi:hypothetical protein